MKIVPTIVPTVDTLKTKPTYYGKIMIKKAYLYGIVLSLTIIFNQTSAKSLKQPPRKKSRDVALIKAIGGSLLTCVSAVITLQGTLFGIFGYKDNSKDMKIWGAIEIPAGALLAIIGYKLAKKGFRDLNDLAQD